METIKTLFAAQDLQLLFQTYVMPWGVNIVLALLILVFGRWLAKAIVGFFKRMMRRAEYDQMLINFLGATLQALLMVVVIIAALDRLGVATTSIVAVLGAAGLAIGLALQGSLQNFASGIMILIFRPFRTGHYVEAGGSSGTVENVGIFSTTLTSVDNKEVIVPNGNIYRDTIINYSARGTRRIDLVIGVSYESNLAVVKEILEKVIAAESRVLEEPAPYIAVSELADSSVNLVVRPWVKTPDYFTTRCALTEAIKLELEARGIAIPYPQLDVHYQQPDTQPAD